MPCAIDATEGHQNARTEEPKLLLPAPAQLRAWTIKSATSLVDQALTSGTGLIANVLLARWMSAAEYGAFAVAFAAYLFLTLFHSALLLDPTSVMGPARHAQHLPAYFHAQLRVHGLLVWPLSTVALLAAFVLSRKVPHSPLIDALVGGALALPFMLLLWLTRRMAYVLQRPALAVSGSAAYFGLSLAALIAFHTFFGATPIGAFFALGLGSLLGACLMFGQAGLIRPSIAQRSAIAWRDVLLEDWRYGRWLVGSAVLYAISTSSQTFFAAGALGLGAAGVLRAMQLPSLVMTQIIASIGVLVLPVLSYDFGAGLITSLRRKAIVLGIALGLTSMIFAGFLALFATPLERVLFNGRYAFYAEIIPLMALIPVCNGLCTGYSLALRASQKPFCDFVANAGGAFAALLSMAVFVRFWQVYGAALSMVLSFAVMNLITSIFFFFVKRFHGAPAEAVNSHTRLPASPLLPAALKEDG